MGAWAASAERVIERGVVRDWEALESLLSASVLSVSERSREGDRDRDRSEGDKSSGHQFLVTTPPLEDSEGKEKLLQILFETFAADAVALLPRAPLGLFASGTHNAPKIAAASIMLLLHMMLLQESCCLCIWCCCCKYYAAAAYGAAAKILLLLLSTLQQVLKYIPAFENGHGP